MKLKKLFLLCLIITFTNKSYCADRLLKDNQEQNPITWSTAFMIHGIQKGIIAGPGIAAGQLAASAVILIVTTGGPLVLEKSCEIAYTTGKKLGIIPPNLEEDGLPLFYESKKDLAENGALIQLLKKCEAPEEEIQKALECQRILENKHASVQEQIRKLTLQKIEHTIKRNEQYRQPKEAANVSVSEFIDLNPDHQRDALKNQIEQFASGEEGGPIRDSAPIA